MEVDQVIERLTRVLKLDSAVFTEIADDENGTSQAVIVSAVAAGISSLLGESNIIVNIISGLIAGAIGLFIWSGLVFIASKLFKGQADYIRLVRPIGYAAAPYALGLIPFLGIVGLVYSLIIQIRAVREVAQISDGAAIATVLLPFALIAIPIILIILLVVGAAIGGLAF